MPRAAAPIRQGGPWRLGRRRIFGLVTSRRATGSAPAPREVGGNPRGAPIRGTLGCLTPHNAAPTMSARARERCLRKAVVTTWSGGVRNDAVRGRMGFPRGGSALHACIPAGAGWHLRPCALVGARSAGGARRVLLCGELVGCAHWSWSWCGAHLSMVCSGGRWWCAPVWRVPWCGAPAIALCLMCACCASERVARALWWRCVCPSRESKTVRPGAVRKLHGCT